MKMKTSILIVLILTLVFMSCFIIGMNWGSSIWDNFETKQEAVNS